MQKAGFLTTRLICNELNCDLRNTCFVANRFQRRIFVKIVDGRTDGKRMTDGRQRVFTMFKSPGAGCSKFTTSLVNVSLNLKR